MNKDQIMLLLLVQFAEKGFPSTDPQDQVATAYLYTELIAAYKAAKAARGKEPIVENPCPKCGKSMKEINLATMDDPGAKLQMCAECGFQQNIQSKEPKK